MSDLSSAKDKPLFTPGPLTTSRTVKQAMLRDLGSRDQEFLRVVREIRAQLLDVAGLGDDYTCVLMQGSGTFTVEAVIGSSIPPKGKLLILSNGAYGKRMVTIARTLRIEHAVIEYPEHCSTNAQDAAHELARDPTISHVAMVHSETTSGLVNLQGYIIVSFLYPAEPWFDLTFYARLNERGFVIYPGKVGTANCFRVGCIGRLFPADIANLLNAMCVTLDEMRS